MQDDFGIRGGLEDRALAHQLVPQEVEIGQVAVVGDGDAALVQIGEHRLDVAQETAAGNFYSTKGEMVNENCNN